MNRAELDELLVPRSAGVADRASFFYQFMGKTAQALPPAKAARTVSDPRKTRVSKKIAQAYECDAISEITKKRLMTDEIVDDKGDVAVQNAAKMIAMQESELEQYRQQLATVSQNAQETQQQATQMIQGLQQQVQQLGQAAQQTQQVMTQARQMQSQMGAQIGEATQAALQAGQAATMAQMESFRTKQDLMQLEQGVQQYKETLRQAIENDPVQQRMQQQAMQQQQIAMAQQQAQMAMAGGGQPGQEGQPQPGQPQQGQEQPQQGQEQGPPSPEMANAGKMASLRRVQLNDRDVILKMAIAAPSVEATSRIAKSWGPRIARAAGRHKGLVAAGMIGAGVGGLALAHYLKQRKARRLASNDVLPQGKAPVRNAPFVRRSKDHKLPARNAPSMAAIHA